ncbi:ABC transporter permease [Anaerolineae bacterium CFX7]|nr:ABC transporter permease [Anaerolineae bacterium CFX7]
MARFLIRRLLWLIPVMFVVAIITFVLMHMAPGGPFDKDPSQRQVDAVTQKALNAQFGLDKEEWLDFAALSKGDIVGFFDTQFFTYMIGGTVKGQWRCGFICGNLGLSFRQRGLTVQDIVLKPPEGKAPWDSKAGYSLRLGLLALFFAMLIGVPLGVVSALRQNTPVDYASLFIATSGVTVPNFVFGIFLIIIFAVFLHAVPVVPTSWDSPLVWILPTIVLGFGLLAQTARLTRASMLEVMRQDYIRTARAKGLGERVVVWRHMLKNALIPVVTIMGPALAGLITGSFIIETMFAFPGWGRQFVTAIQQRDYSMILATTLIFALLIQIANMTVDLIYTFLDPRIKVN